MIKNKSGITLIALVITVIILLILAATVISISVNGGGIFSRTEDAVEKWNKKVENEQSVLDLLEMAYEYTENEDVPENAVARIGSQYYTTLQSALDDVPSDNTRAVVLLLKDISENVIAQADKRVVLYLNGHTIQNEDDTPIITISGNMTITGGTITGQYGIKEVASVLVNENAELSLSNTLVDRNSEDENGWYTVEIHGKLKINSGKVNSSNSNALNNKSTGILEISDTAEITSIATGFPTLWNHGDLKINGGIISSTNSTALANDNTISISGGTIYSLNYAAMTNAGTATITGGSIRAEKNMAIYNQQSATLEISGTAEIEGVDNNTALGNYGTATIKGGSIKSTNKVAFTNVGTAVITGGDISSTNSGAINNQSTGILEMSGVDMTGTGGGIVIANHGTATINGGKLKSTNSNVINNQETGTLTLTGAIEIEGTNSETPAVVNHGILTVNEGIITSNSNAINNRATGTLEINGAVEVKGTGSSLPTLYNYGTATLIAGKIEHTVSGTKAVYNSNGTVYKSDDFIIIGGTNGTISPYTGQ
ncbi:MAG: hypothetical protein IKP28_03960 [Clostridia bacterium]|nr:hypothetical protein [Clostridia bacterium]